MAQRITRRFVMKEQNIEQLREALLADDQVRSTISTRAYEIYDSRGGEPGRDLDDWLQAENEVLAELTEELKAPDLAPGSGRAAVEIGDATRKTEAPLVEAAPRKRR
jgi:hypothetical protein